ncbi:uncharacterized protein SPSK_04516 [Sporothrix schenckii 1099-18]|uniref:EKC/KEOPS complex subunit BUD32 n=1 Tax=Sporothrix schenckii 1099-18 TaxID=1397361 RepID=A0A0F2M2A1_SPOSC|nr:uncharacterized protein SPSK_04516 [Sporothrix schenckii 1099-18]KJR83219.1 hypothetical protein SPSK_04516 [Sporothrix schenckii 1099-18]
MAISDMALVITNEEVDHATKLAPPFSMPRLLPDGKTVLKSSDRVREAEANIMKFVAEHTSIPVPEVHNVYRDAKSSHARIVMEYIDGDRLDSPRGYLTELRQIKGAFIGTVDGSGCSDSIFSMNEVDEGPYANKAAFNDALAKAWSAEDEGNPVTRLLCRIQHAFMHDHGIVLTHNDLCPRNILVRGATVVAILDWEFSGFFPEYWEYSVLQTLWRPGWNNVWITEGYVDRILDPYLMEVAVMLNTSTW